MSHADEQLRAAARTASDMFPGGGDLPPLRLAERADGRRTHARRARRAPMDGRRRARVWLAPLAAGAAVIAVAGALAVPHLIAGNNADHHKPVNQAPAAPPSASQHEQSQFDALLVEWVAPATGPQYDAGSKVVWMLRSQEVRSTARCMANRGYHISDKSSPYNLGDYADNTQMPDLPRIARTHQFVSAAWYGVAQSYTRPEQKAFNTCQAAAQAGDAPLWNTSQTINQAWFKVVTHAQASSKVTAAIPALRACARRYGYPHSPSGMATKPINSFSDFAGWDAGYVDGAASNGASNSTIRSLTRHWTSVFVTCATPIASIWQHILLNAQPGFLHQHAQQIARLDRLASQDLVQHD